MFDSLSIVGAFDDGIYSPERNKPATKSMSPTVDDSALGVSTYEESVFASPPSTVADGSRVSHVESLTESPAQSKIATKVEPVHWTVQDVCQWLESCGLGAHAEVFANHGIDGELLFELDGDMIRDDLGITSRLDAKKILTRRGRLQATVSSSVTAGWNEPSDVALQLPSPTMPRSSRTVLDTSFTPRPQQLDAIIDPEQLRRLHAHEPVDHLVIDLRRGTFDIGTARELVDMLELVFESTFYPVLSFI